MSDVKILPAGRYTAVIDSAELRTTPRGMSVLEVVAELRKIDPEVLVTQPMIGHVDYLELYAKEPEVLLHKWLERFPIAKRCREEYFNFRPIRANVDVVKLPPELRYKTILAMVAVMRGARCT